MTLPPNQYPGRLRVNYIKIMYERGYVRVLESSNNFNILMGMCELGEAVAEPGALAGVTKSYTFRLTTKGRGIAQKRMEK